MESIAYFVPPAVQIRMNRGTLSCDAKSDGQFIRERHSTQSIHGTVWHSRHKRSIHDARPASFMVNEFHELGGRQGL